MSGLAEDILINAEYLIGIRLHIAKRHRNIAFVGKVVLGMQADIRGVIHIGVVFTLENDLRNMMIQGIHIEDTADQLEGNAAFQCFFRCFHCFLGLHCRF